MGESAPGDLGAPTFHDLFREHFGRLTRLAHLLGADDPENVVQEAFVKLHQRWDTLADHERVAGYLRTTVVNMSRSRTRHLKVVRRAPQERPPDEPSAEVTALAGWEHRRLRAVLVKLPRRQREVLVLRYWLDLSTAAIAETLGISVGTVKATAHHAIANLRKHWGDEPGGEG
ncbi:SigE family RNA polymerase sigma factor [Amycolatopsis vancoresmycina]|uniref:ECF subfamily RNA polymerase sigma-24 factor n=1 Tax=Amycolatopsis vancoresmycina DSM 44592 TaxID=1292037 RepID=R1GEC6_9PSEU|nr:SigE family RNA polymerase sigma factor [Amycolatopsis vancoresmycina]EOD69657.1 ECF subfamily RNA polymerase sigma-24 factor [Amycolatopsis vancoresmycina DSM 44592]